MALAFSSAITDGTGQPGQSTRSIAHARVRKTYGQITTAAADTDDLVIGYFKSNDQIIDIKFYTNGGSTAGAFNLGLWAVDFHNGATTISDTVDNVLYASAQATSTAILYGAHDADTSIFRESAVLTDADRGTTLWASAAVGDASYTVDPGLTFALVAEVSTTINASTILTFEIDYVAGD
jgi:hypothetical protein